MSIRTVRGSRRLWPLRVPCVYVYPLAGAYIVTLARSSLFMPSSLTTSAVLSRTDEGLVRTFLVVNERVCDGWTGKGESLSSKVMHVDDRHNGTLTTE